MIAYLNRLFNRIRKIKKQWTAQKDKDFHDHVFAAQHYNPFAFSYFGYITIKRFADLAAPYVEKTKSVLDLGCGPAEITCELASRFPHISFLGVDHSIMGIARAKINAQALNLKNIEFQVVAMEAFQATKKFDLILMFDSFHHLSKPRRFLDRMGGYAAQFLLIEPRGDWKGSHIRDFDFDWIVSDLEKIRRRLALKIGEPDAAAAIPGRSEKMPEVAALENRYTLEEFTSFFKGFGLKVRGTVSGLEVFPPDPFLHSPSREFFGSKAYEIFSALDDMLVKNEMDILAKHWVIFASKDLKSNDIRIPRPEFASDDVESVRGPYDVEFLEYDGPRRVKGGSEFRAQVQFHNCSYRRLSSISPENPDFISYRWLDKWGAMVQRDGLRTPLVKIVLPGETGKAEMKIMSPENPGQYILAVDLVQEGKTWFSEAGNPCLRIKMIIKK
ncbi:MAG: class I SAM-dependent methyltransferase [Chrysiogenales bacterium]